MATKTNGTTALAKPLDVQYMALSNPEAFANLQRTLAETMGDDLAPFDFDEVKIPSAGGLSWKVPTLEGNKPMEKVSGVLVYIQAAREYYSGKFTGQSQPPTCFSPDGRNGFGNPRGLCPGGLCRDCPFSQWDSATDAEGNATRGCACSERKHILLLPDDSLIPLFFNIPPTSVKAVEKYCLRIGGKGLDWTSVVTELGLEEAKSGGNITYSVATFAMVGALPSEQAILSRQYADAMGALVRSRFIADAKRRVAEDASEAPAE